MSIGIGLDCLDSSIGLGIHGVGKVKKSARDDCSYIPSGEQRRKRGEPKQLLVRPNKLLTECNLHESLKSRMLSQLFRPPSIRL